jgi:hypothetical protein
MAWSLQYIQKLQKEGRITSYEVIGKPLTAEGKKIQKPEAEGLQFIKKILDSQNIGYMTEYRFAPPRRFRFDICLPAFKVAIEYEGLGFKKTGHTTSDGYTKNCEKYNLAASKGWRLYRYTFKNYKDFENDLKTILNQ